MILIDGRQTAAKLKSEIKQTIEKAAEQGYRAPKIAAVIVGNDGGSEAYVGNLRKICENLGVDIEIFRENADISENDFIKLLDEINKNEGIDGYIVQFPLPKHIDRQKVIESIDPLKDVDGMNPLNVGRSDIGLPSFNPATPSSVIELLKEYGIETSGRHAVVLGRSEIIGRPVASMLMKKQYPGDCTVTVCHSHTKDIAEYTRQADILIAAIGSPRFVKADMVKDGAVVIDVGTTMVEDPTSKSGFRLTGDVDFEQVSPKCSYITPVPGGVGPVTVCCLLRNLLNAWSKRNGFRL